MKKFRAVLWDVDNTLIMSGATHDLAVITALQEFSPPEFNADSLDILARAWDESWFLCGGAADKLDEFEARVAELYLKNLKQMIPRPGAVDTVHFLNDLGITQACVSNSLTSIVDANLQQIGVDNIIKTRICREDFTQPKPDPAPYLLAAEKLDISVAACLAVEDSQRGCLSAKRAGASVIYWPHDPLENEACDYKVDDIQAVPWRDFF